MDERTDSRAILRDAAKWPLLTGCECISDLILRSAPSRQRTCAVRCARLEGWPRVRTLRPSFETLASQAPQDEVGDIYSRPRSPGRRVEPHDFCAISSCSRSRKLM